jgi:hypothetical protein
MIGTSPVIVGCTEIIAYSVCGALRVLASYRVCASIPNFLFLEWHWRERPHWNTLLRTDTPIIQNGYIQMPATPGIGAELNEEAAREYLRPEIGFFEHTVSRSHRSDGEPERVASTL